MDAAGAVSLAFPSSVGQRRAGKLTPERESDATNGIQLKILIFALALFFDLMKSE